MSFLRRSQRTRANPVEAITPHTETRRESLMSRILHPNKVVRQSRVASKRNRREPVVGRKSRGPFRSNKAQPVTDAITPNQHPRRPSFGDRIQGFGNKIAQSLSGRPPQRSAGGRAVTGTRRQGRNRFHL